MVLLPESGSPNLTDMLNPDHGLMTDALLWACNPIVHCATHIWH